MNQAKKDPSRSRHFCRREKGGETGNGPAIRSGYLAAALLAAILFFGQVPGIVWGCSAMEAGGQGSLKVGQIDTSDGSALIQMPVIPEGGEVPDYDRLLGVEVNGETAGGDDPSRESSSTVLQTEPVVQTEQAATESSPSHEEKTQETDGASQAAVASPAQTEAKTDGKEKEKPQKKKKKKEPEKTGGDKKSQASHADGETAGESSILSENPGTEEDAADGSGVKEAGSGSDIADSRQVPADIHIDGAKVGGTFYSKTGKVTVSLPSDPAGDQESFSYRIVPCKKDGTDSGVADDKNWVSSAGGSIGVGQEGVYRVYVRTKDQDGNVNISKSGILCYDRTMPAIKVDGILGEGIRPGEKEVSVSCTDAQYQENSLRASIRGLQNGMVIEPASLEEEEGGASAVFGSFPAGSEYDGIYEMEVSARDKAGNVSKKIVRFSVNRGGSVYELDEDTRKNLEKYYVRDAFDLVIRETNVDYVDESKIFCRRDGILRELEPGKDYQVVLQGDEDSRKQYRYQIDRKVFGEEGVYELLLASKDRAGNSSDTGIQEKKILFALDRTSPTCVIKGIEEQGTYDTDQLKIQFQAKDNLCLRSMKIWHNGSLWREFSSGELEEQHGIAEMTVEKGKGMQTVQVFLEDACGNTYQSNEIPFCFSEEEVGERRVAGGSRERKTGYGDAVSVLGAFLLLAFPACYGFSGKKRKR